MYTISHTNPTSSDEALQLLHDADDVSLEELEQRFQAIFGLFDLRTEALKNLNVDIDEEEADELRQLLGALIRIHQRICTIKGNCR